MSRRLEQVERLILRRVPDLAEQIDTGDLDEQDVIDIEADAVLRVVLHGDGIISETDGSFTYQKAYGTDGRLKLTPDEWAVLGVRVGKMFGISPSIGGCPL